MFPHSKVDIVRMFPVYRSPTKRESGVESAQHIRWHLSHSGAIALANEIARGAAAMGGPADDGETPALILEIRLAGTVADDDGQLNAGPILAISLAEYPAEGVYPIDPLNPTGGRQDESPAAEVDVQSSGIPGELDAQGDEQAAAREQALQEAESIVRQSFDKGTSRHAHSFNSGIHHAAALISGIASRRAGRAALADTESEWRGPTPTNEEISYLADEVTSWTTQGYTGEIAFARVLLDRYGSAPSSAEQARDAQYAARYRRINTPEISDFLSAVHNEALHQRERWGSQSDSGKADPDWFWLIGYLAGKAIRPDAAPEKQLHHIITTAAACLNWHGARVGAYVEMRPGISDPDATATSKGEV
jgi:hypothetical protein